MNLSKIGDVLKDWVKGGYWFGKAFSNSIADKMDMSPKATRVGGGIFDAVAGGGLAYMAGTSALATLTSTVAAVTAIATAPASAVVAVAVGTVWMALSCMTAGIGIGLLHAAQEKSGMAMPGASVVNQARTEVAKTSFSVKNGFKRLTSSFKQTASPKSAFATPSQKPDVGPKPKL